MEPLKNRISSVLISQYAGELENQLGKNFDKKLFLDFIFDSDWESRELMDRINRVAIAIDVATKGSFDTVATGLEKAAPIHPSGFEQIIFPEYVKLFGQDEFERSMLALERLTVYSTGEFAIRPFLKNDPNRVMQKMEEWSKHENEHIRRFACEGCRPRLPWGGNIPAFIEDPEPIFPILKRLRNDESLYVRKSVANNMNDISKDHPETVLRIAECWLNEKKTNSTWVAKKALRTLLKQPHPKALELFEYANPDSIELPELQLNNAAPRIGEEFEFSFKVKSVSEEIQKLRVEYLIEFKKKFGSSTKVFQISEFDLDAKLEKAFTKRHSFKDLTTRKHYPGSHTISIRINGGVKAACDFQLKS